MKKIIFYILLVSGLFSLTTCKKYPENIVLLKNPEKIYPFQGHLTKYTVNGIDSLDLLNAYFGNFPGLIKDIRKSEFFTFIQKGDIDCELLHGNSLANHMSYSFIRKKKYVTVFFYQDTAIYRKHLFITHSTEWKIIRLAKKGPFKIETTLNNGNKYEIQIE